MTLKSIEYIIEIMGNKRINTFITNKSYRLNLAGLSRKKWDQSDWTIIIISGKEENWDKRREMIRANTREWTLKMRKWWQGENQNKMIRDKKRGEQRRGIWSTAQVQGPLSEQMSVLVVDCSWEKWWARDRRQYVCACVCVCACVYVMMTVHLPVSPFLLLNCYTV